MVFIPHSSINPVMLLFVIQESKMLTLNLSFTNTLNVITSFDMHCFMM